MAAMVAAGEFPEIISNAFVTKELNSAGIIAVKLYLRGKPHIITIDDEFLFSNGDLVYAKPDPNSGALWAPILEKAWAKLKSNYLRADGGLLATGLRAMTGAPTFSYDLRYLSQYMNATGFYAYLTLNNDLDFLIASGTNGDGDDSVFNSCGIAKSHAYAIIETFNMTLANGTEINMIMLRNPWSVTYYNQEWSHDDPNWTQELVD